MKQKGVLLSALLLVALVSYIPLCKTTNDVETWVLIVAGNDWRTLSLQFLRDSYYAYYVFAYHFEVPDDYNEHIKYYYCWYPETIEYQVLDGPSTKENVRSAIAWLSTVSDSNDNIFIYFVCHGAGAFQNGTLDKGAEIDIDGDEGLEYYNCTTGEWFGVDECLKVYGDACGYDELYWDDELKQDLSNVTYGQMVVLIQSCVIGNQTCFSGGFIDDLSGPDRVIITAANETYFSWGDIDSYLGVQDGFSEFSEGFFDALYGYDTRMDFGDIQRGEPVNADFNNDGEISISEAWQYAYEHDDARWSVRTLNGTIEDPLGEFGEGVDESPWMDDNGDGLPTFKAGYDIFLLGDFNFDGRVDVTDLDMFLEAYNSEEYHPLYDLDGHGTIDGWDFLILRQCLEKRDLSISASSGGTTDPAPGTHTYILNSQASVTAIPNSDSGGYYYFTHWLLNGATVYSNPITVTMDSNHTLEAHFRWSTCPTLFV